MMNDDDEYDADDSIMDDDDDDDIDKMATHLILGPRTGDTDEIGFPSRQKNEIAKNNFFCLKQDFFVFEDKSLKLELKSYCFKRS